MVLTTSMDQVPTTHTKFPHEGSSQGSAVFGLRSWSTHTQVVAIPVADSFAGKVSSALTALTDSLPALLRDWAATILAASAPVSPAASPLESPDASAAARAGHAHIVPPAPSRDATAEAAARAAHNNPFSAHPPPPVGGHIGFLPSAGASSASDQQVTTEAAVTAAAYNPFSARGPYAAQVRFLPSAGSSSAGESATVDRDRTIAALQAELTELKRHPAEFLSVGAVAADEAKAVEQAIAGLGATELLKLLHQHNLSSLRLAHAVDAGRLGLRALLFELYFEKQAQGSSPQVGAPVHGGGPKLPRPAAAFMHTTSVLGAATTDQVHQHADAPPPAALSAPLKRKLDTFLGIEASAPPKPSEPAPKKVVKFEELQSQWHDMSFADRLKVVGGKSAGTISEFLTVDGKNQGALQTPTSTLSKCQLWRSPTAIHLCRIIFRQ